MNGRSNAHFESDGNRCPVIVRSGSNRHPRLGRDQGIISSTFQSLAEDFLR
jgi:hypothetical protein